MTNPIKRWVDLVPPAAAIRPPRDGAAPAFRVDSGFGTDAQASSGSDFIELPEYRLVEELVLGGDHPLVVLSGRAGTGKSVAIRWLATRFDGGCAVVAPTGLAAIQVGGQTLHSLFKFPARLIQASDIKPPGARSREIFAHLKLLIIDEISMVRVDVMEAVGRFLERFGPRPGTPFGGVKLVLVGDLLQLPPVVDSRAEHQWIRRTYDSEYFFSAHCFKANASIPVELTRVFRQTDAKFIEILSDIRTGNGLPAAIGWLNQSCIGKPRPAGVPEISLVPTRELADEINRRELGRLGGPRRSYCARVEGRVPADRNLPSPNDLELRVGAQVMFTKNDQSRRWVNGTAGMVVDLGDSHVEVAIPGTPGSFTVQPERWDQHEYQWDETAGRLVAAVVGSFIQIPLMLAWASTIHKSQGQTFDHALVDLGRGAFASGQTYVAISRCRSHRGLRLGRAIREDDVKVDPSLLQAYRAMQATASRIDPAFMADQLRNRRLSRR
jgi:ATP-dependent DNA helicase PIF1